MHNFIPYKTSDLYTIVPKMLWMLGVAAIIVDIVSRFSGYFQIYIFKFSHGGFAYA